jgi:hypothetical protein
MPATEETGQREVILMAQMIQEIESLEQVIQATRNERTEARLALDETRSLNEQMQVQAIQLQRIEAERNALLEVIKIQMGTLADRLIELVGHAAR